MGREQKRKELKKQHNNKSQNIKKYDTEVKFTTLLKIVLIIALILLAVYYILAIFVTKEIDLSSDNKDNNTTENSSNNSSSNTSNNVENKILASATFRQSPQVYYVYYYDFNNEEKEISDNISKLTDSTIYRVNTAEGLNKNYVTDSSGNRDVKEIRNLKVKNPTLIKIEDDSVIEYHEGVDDIVNFINK